MARVIGKVLSATEIYFDSAYFTPTLSGGAVEGTAVLSTGEAGGTKFLREDGDGTSSWQTAGGHTQNTDTGTTGNTFTIDSDSVTGNIILDVTLNAGENHKMTVTNAVMVDDVTLTLPATTGTVALTSDLHTQNTDTGTTGNTFTVDSDSTTGKIIVDVALGAADLSLTLTNEALTSSSKTITFPNATGTVSLLALGENSTNAYRGDRGKTAYDHSQAAHADIGADNTTAQLNGGSPAILTAEIKIITLDTEVISNFSYGDLLKELDARYVEI